MYPPCLTVIEGGNPDDQYTDRSRLQLVVLEPSVTASAEPEGHPLIMNILDGTIAITVQLLFSLGAFRTRVAKSAPYTAATGTDAPWTGRGW